MTEIIQFSDLNLSSEIMSALTAMEFTTPSPIQAQAIPLLLEGQDIIGQAQTGTGKTAAFGIPAIESIDLNLKKTQVIVLCPTRELALQVSEQLKKLAQYKKGLRVVPIFGGASMDKQISDLKFNPYIVVGTPGRVIDHIDRGNLKLDHIHTFILDEADEMLNMGFIEDIESILEIVPEERQTVFFSATMPPAILELTKRFQRNPKIVKVTPKELTVSTIEQFYFEVRDAARIDALGRLIKVNNLKMIMVFCNTKRVVDELVENLQVKGISAEGLHGDLRQTQRNNVLAKFKSGTISVLVATDVAARGIDVNGVDAVFNYDIPLDEENYVHRIGRTGRAGRLGKSFTFVTGRKDSQRLKDIARYTKVEITPGKIPSAAEMLEIQKNTFFEKVINSINNDEIENYKEMAEELLNSNISPKNLLASLIKLQFNGLEGTKMGDDDINLNIAQGGDRRERSERGGGRDRYESRDRGGRADRGRGDRDRNSSYGGERGGRERRSSSEGGSRDRQPRDFHNGGENVKLFINVGKNFRISPGDILGAIVGEARVEGKEIGAIEIRDKYSYVSVPKNKANNIIDALSQSKIKGAKVNVEIAST